MAVIRHYNDNGRDNNNIYNDVHSRDHGNEPSGTIKGGEFLVLAE